MLRRFVISVLLAAVVTAPAAASTQTLIPGLTYTRQVLFTPHGPVTEHVLVAPRPGGLWAVRPALSAFEESPGAEPGALDESIEQAALRWQMAAALARLTPEHREVVRLAHYEGMTMREIAEAKGLPIGTIKSRAWYAMRSLRLTLEEMEGVA